MANAKKEIRLGKSVTTRVLVYVLCTLLIIYASVILLSLFWALITSLKNPYEFSSLQSLNKVGFPTLDKDNPLNSREEFFKLKNYATIFQHLKYKRTEVFYRGQVEVTHYAGGFDGAKVGLGGMLLRTLLYTVGGAAIQAFMPCMTAYLCAKYDEFKLSGIIFVVYLFMMCMPIVGNYPTELTFLRNIGIYDTIWGNWIQKMTGSGMYYFVYYAYFKGVSNTYREAAEIDGAPQIVIMFRIYFPLAIKMVSTVFLIQFVTLWNDYQTPLLYLPTFPTLAYAIFLMNSDNGSGEDMRELYGVTVRMAGCMLLAVPITLIFIIFKERLMGDVSLGGIKE